MTTEPDEASVRYLAFWEEYKSKQLAYIKQKEIEIWLHAAQPMNDKRDRCPRDTEELRLAAIRELRALYHSPPVEDRVRNFFDEKWESILRAPNPAAAAAEFFNGKSQRGRPPNSKERNFQIARAVQECIDAGMTVEKACEETRLRHAPELASWERIREIYYGPTVGEEERANWHFAIGARKHTAAQLLYIMAIMEPMMRFMAKIAGRDPESWLDFLINGDDFT